MGDLGEPDRQAADGQGGGRQQQPRLPADDAADLRAPSTMATVIAAAANASAMAQPKSAAVRVEKAGNVKGLSA